MDYRVAVVVVLTMLMISGPLRAAQPADPVSHDSIPYVPVVVDEPIEAQIVVVKPGDHLWKISKQHLDGGVAVGPYWLDVIEANRSTLRSGDPDLIFPGELIVLPVSTSDGR